MMRNAIAYDFTSGFVASGLGDALVAVQSGIQRLPLEWAWDKGPGRSEREWGRASTLLAAMLHNMLEVVSYCIYSTCNPESESELPTDPWVIAVPKNHVHTTQLRQR